MRTRTRYLLALLFVAACGSEQRRGETALEEPRLDGFWMLERLDGGPLPGRDEVQPCDAKPFFSEVRVRDGRWVQRDSSRADCGQGPEVLVATVEQAVELANDTVFAVDAAGSNSPPRRRMIAFFFGDSLVLFGNDMVAAHWMFHRKE